MGTGNMSGKGSGLQMGVSSDIKTTILNVMKEMAKNNKFIHKQDIWAFVQKHTTNNEFERALTRLCDDSLIYSTYDNDIYSLNDN